MIIRITVHDNDFQTILERFCKNFYMNITEIYGLSDDNMDYEKLSMYRKRSNEIRSLFNPNNDIVLTKEVKESIKKIVKEGFNTFVMKNNPKNAEYLKKNVQIDVLSRMEDKWENGEVFYWFQHSDKFLCQ